MHAIARLHGFALIMLLQGGALARAGACADLARRVDAAGSGTVFVASYATAEVGPLHRTAFLYDNAVAVIALIGCDELPRAQRIGDALLHALGHDRHWQDGRLRNAYAAGAVGGGGDAVGLPGWWGGPQSGWLEDRYQVGSDSGNNAWAALALLQLARASGAVRYREGAERIATWLQQQQDRRGAGGFSGGTFGHEPAPRAERWKSTEHNIDLAVVLERLGRWDAAAAARRFVRSMWDPACRCFAVGTGVDGITPNRLLALDVQAWALLSGQFAGPRDSEYRQALATVERRLRFGSGYSYSEALSGVWTEGTAQLALLQAQLHQDERFAELMSALRQLRAPEGGYFATSATSEPTGFGMPTDPGQPLQYLHLPHLGATAWVALAERRFNPFTGPIGAAGTNSLVPAD